MESGFNKELSINIINNLNLVNIESIIKRIDEYNNKYNTNILQDIKTKLTEYNAKFNDKRNIIKNIIEYDIKLFMFKKLREFIHESGRKIYIIYERLLCSIIKDKDFEDDKLDETNKIKFIHRICHNLYDLSDMLMYGELMDDLNEYINDNNGYYSTIESSID